MGLDSLGLTPLRHAPRLLIEVPLRPIHGVRFQPASFPETGPAFFSDPDGLSRVIVESVQGVANHLEATLWSPNDQALRPDLAQLSHVRVHDDDGTFLTASVLEAHRLDSPYVRRDGAITERLETLLGPDRDPKRLPEALYRLDAACLLHGVFLQSLGPRFRVARAISGYIEAFDAEPISMSGVKSDLFRGPGAARDGYGTVLFHREEFVARAMTAFFSLDLAQIRSYRLGPDATELLLLLALFEIAQWLEGPMRLRSRCDLVVEGPLTSAPEVVLPAPALILESLAERIESESKFETTRVVHPRPQRK